MAIKTFGIPAPIAGVTFVAYVRWLLNNDARASASPSNSRIAARIEQAVMTAADNGTAVSVLTADLPIFKALVNNPDVSCRARFDGDAPGDVNARTLVMSSADAPFIAAVNGAV